MKTSSASNLVRSLTGLFSEGLGVPCEYLLDPFAIGFKKAPSGVAFRLRDGFQLLRALRVYGVVG